MKVVDFLAPGSGSALLIQIWLQESQINANPDPQHWLQVHDLRDQYLRYCSFHPDNLDQKAWYNNFLNNIFRNFVSIHGAEIFLLCSIKKVSKMLF